MWGVSYCTLLGIYLVYSVVALYQLVAVKTPRLAEVDRGSAEGLGGRIIPMGVGVVVVDIWSVYVRLGRGGGGASKPLQSLSEYFFFLAFKTYF